MRGRVFQCVSVESSARRVLGTFKAEASRAQCTACAENVTTLEEAVVSYVFARLGLPSLFCEFGYK